jgi:uncharacterized membrane protein
MSGLVWERPPNTESGPKMAMAMMSWMFAIPMLGFATGLRTMTPMAILCWFAYLHHLPIRHSWAFWAANLITAIVFSVMALGEYVGDKLPNTPNRISAFPLIARLCFGGLVGGIAATGLRGSLVEGVLLGAIGALAGSFIGYQLRTGLRNHFQCKDAPIAITEDVVAVVLSVLAMGIVTG